MKIVEYLKKEKVLALNDVIVLNAGFETPTKYNMSLEKFEPADFSDPYASFKQQFVIPLNKDEKKRSEILKTFESIFLNMFSSDINVKQFQKAWKTLIEGDFLERQNLKKDLPISILEIDPDKSKDAIEKTLKYWENLGISEGDILVNSKQMPKDIDKVVFKYYDESKKAYVKADRVKINELYGSSLSGAIATVALWVGLKGAKTLPLFNRLNKIIIKDASNTYSSSNDVELEEGELDSTISQEEWENRKKQINISEEAEKDLDF